MARAAYLAWGPAGGDSNKGRLLWYAVVECRGPQVDHLDSRRLRLTLHAEFSPLLVVILSTDRVSTCYALMQSTLCCDKGTLTVHRQGHRARKWEASHRLKGLARGEIDGQRQL